MGYEWVGDNRQRNILRVFGYEEPFFRVEESCPEHKCGRVGWAKERPFGMNFSDNSFTFDYGSRHAVYIINMTGEFPHLKYQNEKKICWGEKEII